jgi:hypothetical protein
LGRALLSGCVWALVASSCLVFGLATAEDRVQPVSRRPSRRKPAAIPKDSGDAVDRKLGDGPAGEPNAADPDQKTEKASPFPRTLIELIQWAESSQAALADVKDYTAVFTKKEMIKGRLVQQVMDMKFRAKPFSVYFRYRSGAEAGRQAIYVEGKFGNKLVVKEVGVKALAGTMYLVVDSSLVMAENRYPVTNVGIHKILDKSAAVWDRESKLEDAQIDLKFFPHARLGDVACEAVQLTYPKPARDFEYQLTRVYFDKESRLPIRAERFGWPRRAGEKPPLVEDYAYTNLKTNVKLTDADFDPARYGF